MCWRRAILEIAEQMVEESKAVDHETNCWHDERGQEALTAFARQLRTVVTACEPQVAEPMKE